MLQVFSVLSSKIDWCEPNFVVSVYIAEFWNTISNLPFMIIAPLLIYLHQEYSNRIPKTKFVNVVWICYLITGCGNALSIADVHVQNLLPFMLFALKKTLYGTLCLLGCFRMGSVYFHSTLSLFGQFVDEVGILWICCACMAVWTLDIYLPKYFQIHRGRYQLCILLMAVTATFLGLMKPEINHFFLFIFVLPSVWALKDQTSRITSTEYQYLSKRTFQLWMFALICWVLDRFFCSFWLGLKFPYLHGIWHILTAIGGYTVCICFSYSFALEQAPQEIPIIKFHCLFSHIKWLGLWHVTFDNVL